jgi:O-antigen ligase
MNKNRFNRFNLSFLQTNILTFQSNQENKINLLLNHLAVVYMFFVPFAPHSYAVSFLFTLGYILLFVRGHYIKYINSSLSHPLVIPFLLMAMVHYIWLIGTADIDFATSTLDYSHYLLYPFFFLLFLDQRFYSRLLTSFLAGVMFSELLSYLMQFHIIPPGYSVLLNVPWKESVLDISLYASLNGEPAPFLEHSWYSVLLAVSGSIFFYKGLNSESLKLKIFNFLFFTSISVNLFLIGGRTGYILYFLLILAIIITMIKKKVTIKNILIGLTIPLFVTFFMYQVGGLFQKRVDHSLNAFYSLKTTENFAETADGSFNNKFLKATASIELISKHFLFGVGTGDQLSELRSNPKNIDNPIQKYRDVHNQYLDMWMQFGLIGFSFYIYLLYTIVKLKVDNEEKNILKTIAFIAIVFTGFLASFWYFLPILFTVLVVLATVDKNTITTQIEEPNFKMVLSYIAMILFSYGVDKLQ